MHNINNIWISDRRTTDYIIFQFIEIKGLTAYSGYNIAFSSLREGA